MDANERLKREIKAHLAKKGMTQTELASRLNMSRSSLSNILSGDRGLLTGNAVKILDELHLQILLGKEADS